MVVSPWSAPEAPVARITLAQSGSVADWVSDPIEAGERANLIADTVDTVFVAATQELYALDADSGEIRSRATFAAPADDLVSDGEVAVVEADGVLTAYQRDVDRPRGRPAPRCGRTCWSSTSGSCGSAIHERRRAPIRSATEPWRSPSSTPSPVSPTSSIDLSCGTWSDLETHRQAIELIPGSDDLVIAPLGGLGCVSRWSSLTGELAWSSVLTPDHTDQLATGSLVVGDRYLASFPGSTSFVVLDLADGSSREIEAPAAGSPPRRRSPTGSWSPRRCRSGPTCAVR